MSYIGNTPTTQSFIAGTDTFSGTGSQTAFTLSRSVNSVNDILVVVNNVDQQPTTYTAAGTTLTFSAAPSSGTNNIYVRYLTTTLQSIAPSQGTITPTAVSDQLNTSTGYFDLPTGTTAQRPASPANGMVRYNTTTNKFEVYQASGWTNYVPSYDIDYLVVAGGGGGGMTAGGGGGAGGYRANSLSVTSGATSTVTIGAGGAGGASDGQNGVVGSPSVFGSVTAAGGGYGAHGGGGATGGTGGSGGGGGYGTNAGGAGTSGQGFAGGSTTSTGSSEFPCGGGGGASAVGGNATSASTVGGAGGAGSTWLNGSTYAGGGGGSGTGNPAGGAGGGGRGGRVSDSTKLPGTVNTGGGGGGGAGGAALGTGGSGIVIVRYEGAQRGSGGTVTSSGGYTYHTFTTSGTYTA